VRAAPEGEWRPLKRSGGAWDILDGPVPDDGDGVVFRLTSAQGEVIEGTTVIPFLDESALSLDPLLEQACRSQKIGTRL